MEVIDIDELPDVVDLASDDDDSVVDLTAAPPPPPRRPPPKRSTDATDAVDLTDESPPKRSRSATPRKSVKEMKATITRAGLPTSDLVERADVEARHAAALDRLAEAENASGGDAALARRVAAREKERERARERRERKDAELARRLAAEEETARRAAKKNAEEKEAKRKAEAQRAEAAKKRAAETKRRAAAAAPPPPPPPATDDSDLSSTPTGLAAVVTESLRDCARDGLEMKNACANFDLAVKFFEKHARMLSAAPTFKSGPRRGTRSTPLAVVYCRGAGSSIDESQLTPRAEISVETPAYVAGTTARLERSFDPLWTGTCACPTAKKSGTSRTTASSGGAYIRRPILASPSRAFAARIFDESATPRPRRRGCDVAAAATRIVRGDARRGGAAAGTRIRIRGARASRRRYAKDGIVFACLALPGKQYKATQKRDRGVPKKPGFDSHLGYEGDGAPQLVFFDEDQLLPCYLVDQRNHPRAHRALERAVRTISEKTGNARPSDGLPKSRTGRRPMPGAGAFAAGAGAPTGPGGAFPTMPGYMPGGAPALSPRGHSTERVAATPRLPRGYFSDESQRRRGSIGDRHSTERVAATPRLPRGYSAETRRASGTASKRRGVDGCFQSQTRDAGGEPLRRRRDEPVRRARVGLRLRRRPKTHSMTVATTKRNLCDLSTGLVRHASCDLTCAAIQHCLHSPAWQKYVQWKFCGLARPGPGNENRSASLYWDLSASPPSTSSSRASSAASACAALSESASTEHLPRASPTAKRRPSAANARDVHGASATAVGGATASGPRIPATVQTCTRPAAVHVASSAARDGDHATAATYACAPWSSGAPSGAPAAQTRAVQSSAAVAQRPRRSPSASAARAACADPAGCAAIDATKPP